MKELKKPTVLLTRFGGIGDIVPVMITARQLKKKGYIVHVALREDDHGNRQIDLIENTNDCDQAFTYKQVGPWNTRCVKSELGWLDIKSIYNRYDEVVDYMNIVESNSTSPFNLVDRPCTEWRRSRNSNYTNWCDMHLAWGNVDPTSVNEDEKRPNFKLSKTEIKWGKEVKKGHSHLFVISPFSSSLARSWYQSKYMPAKLLEKYPNAIVALWDAYTNKWGMYTSNKKYELRTPAGSAYRASMALVGASDLFIGVDTGFTHVAEGLNKKHIALYSTVPWWTRAKYYKHQTHIDMGEVHPEYYTFSLLKGDPLNIKEGMLGLSDREKKLLAMNLAKVSEEQACEELNTTPNGLHMEFNALNVKQQSFEEKQAKALTDVTVDMVMDKVGELCQQ